ncbi:MAG: MIP/aquaporin family protein [Thermoplasmata archaeon]
MTWSLRQKCIAEFVGTFGLLLSVTGAALLSLNLSSPDPWSRVLLISFALGLGVLGMAYAFGDISGASFNPAITVGAWAAGRMSGREALSYIVAEVLGGILAVGLVAVVAYGAPAAWPGALASGFASQGYAGNGSPYTVAAGSVFLLEAMLTFFLVLVALFTTRSGNSTKNLAAVGIALTLAMTNLVAIPIDGASINPARSFAPALLSVFWVGSRWAIEQDWIFWVAPLVGGLIAAAVERALRE